MTTKQIHSLKKRKVVTKTKMKKMTTMTSCLFDQERLRIRGYRELSRCASHLFHDFIRGRLGHSSYCQLQLQFLEISRKHHCTGIKKKPRMLFTVSWKTPGWRSEYTFLCHTHGFLASLVVSQAALGFAGCRKQ